MQCLSYARIAWPRRQQVEAGTARRRQQVAVGPADRPDYQSLSQSVSLESQLSNTSLEESFEDSW